jgi:hypothetical protein
LQDAPARMAADTESSSNMISTSTAAVGTARASSRVVVGDQDPDGQRQWCSCVVNW